MPTGGREEFAQFSKEILLFLSDISGSGEDPSRASRKARPLEPGTGKLSPPASSEGVSARAWERRDKGISFQQYRIIPQIDELQKPIT